MKIKERIHNIQTGKIEDIERDMTPEEIESLNERKAETERLLAEKGVIEAKRLAALAKLEALGLSVDDLKALGLG